MVPETVHRELVHRNSKSATLIIFLLIDYQPFRVLRTLAAQYSSMYTYTMTFVSEQPIGLPKEIISCHEDVKSAVAQKLALHEFELADFNWTGAYSFDNSLSYLQEPYRLNCVVEFRVRLDSTILSNREAIYQRCLEALTHHEVILRHSHYIDEPAQSKKCIIRFDLFTAA